MDGKLGQQLSPDLISKWDSALVGNDRATIFSYPDWLVPRHEKAPAGSHFLFDLGHGVASCRFRVRNLTRTVYLNGFDYTDIVAAPGYELACVTKLLEELYIRRHQWDVCDFRSLGSFSSLMSVIAPQGVLSPPPDLCPLLKGLTLNLIPHSAYSCINLPDSWKEFEMSLSPKLASQLRAEQGRRDRNFQSNEICLATPESFERDIAAFINLHQKRWTEKGHSGFFAKSEVLTRSCQELMARGSLLLYTLWIEDKAVGALLCFSCGDRILHYSSGFDIEFKKFRPVKVLIARAIQDGIDAKKTVFDFMKGDEPYKEEWANGSLTNYRLVIARRNIVGSAASLALKLSSNLKNR